MSKLKILVADDSIAICEMLEAALTDNGHVVLIAHSAEEAIACFNNSQPDLVLMDLIMPGMGGAEAIKRIRQANVEKWVPIIVITSALGDEALFDSFMAGADDFLTKPINPLHLELRVQSMTRISDLQKKHYALMNAVIDGVIKIDPAGRVLDMNVAAEKIFMYPKHEVVGQNVNMLMPSPFRESHDQYMADYMATGVPKIIGKGREVTGLRKNGEQFPMHLGVSEGLSDRYRFFVGIVRDLSKEKALAEALAYEQMLMTGLVENSDSLIYFKACDGKYLKVNKTFEQVIGLNRDQLLGRTDFELFPHHLAEAFREVDETVQRDLRIFKGEEVFERDGEQQYFLTTKFPIEGKSGGIEAICGISTEITNLKRAQKALELLSETDELSGLFNRRHFMSLASRELLRAVRCSSPVSVLMIDADHFKNINDTYGHAAGDKVIKAIGQVISSKIRSVDIAGRIGGEEFVVMLPDTSAPQAAVVAEKIRLALGHHAVRHSPHTIQFTVSIGVSGLSHPEQALQTLLDEADQALYRAKSGGRDQVCVFALPDH